MEEKRLAKEYGKEKRVNKFVLVIVTIIDTLLFLLGIICRETSVLDLCCRWTWQSSCP